MDVYSDYCYAAGFLLIIRKLAIQATGIKSFVWEFIIIKGAGN